MRVLQNNFGLVGKSIRKYLTTTALTATGLMALATPSLADNWTDHVADEGSISIDTSIPNTTNITQGTDFVKVHGDGDINAGWTVNVAQPSGSSKYVLYDIENDPTEIMGALNANGQIYIFDKNGVIFGKDSQVNVGSITASTGTISDQNIKENKLVFENVGGPGAGTIVNNGTITVADSGLAAFVAPTVTNAGVINAKLGKVALASGEKVTLDLYGDGLVEIAADGALENALVENTGTINANGGTVVLSAQAAKGAVDDVINMKGVVDVSSVSMKGGKIILSGGGKGKVNVTGTLNAAGKNGGGDIKISGQTIETGADSLVLADAIDNGNGGTIHSFATEDAIYRGRFYARGGETGGNGGSVELSAGDGLGYEGQVNTSAANGEAGQFLLDPAHAIIHSGWLDPIGWFQLVIKSENLANDMHNNGSVTVQASDVIDVGTDLAFPGIGNGDIDVSNYSYSSFDLVGFIHIGPFNIPQYAWVNHSGPNTGNLKLLATTVNFNKNLIMGGGTLTVLSDTINLGAKIYTNATLMGQALMSGIAGTINVLSDHASVQQAVWLAKDTGTTINVAAGTYNEHVDVTKSVTLKGANAGKAGNDPTRGAESIIDPSSPGFHVTADDAVIDGFEITSADDGVFVDNADNATVKNNYIHDVLESGVDLLNSIGSTVSGNLISHTGLEGVSGHGSDNLTVNNNVINNTGKDGIALYTSRFATIVGNYIGYTGALISAGVDNIFGDGVLLDNSDGDASTYAKIQGNTITETHNTANEKGSGVQLINSDYVLVGSDDDGVDDAAEGNTISHAYWDGVRIAGSSTTNNIVRGNTVTDAEQSGVYAIRANNLLVDSNVITETGYNVFLHHPTDPYYGAITSDFGSNIMVTDNTITDAGKGVRLFQAGGVNSVTGNHIDDTVDDGIYAKETNNITVSGNTIGYGADGVFGNDDTTIGGRGIYVERGNTKTIVTSNHVTGTKNFGISIASGANIDVSGNHVDNAAADAIHVSTADTHVKINGNRIGQESGSTIKGDGIYLEKAKGGVIQSNIISNTKKETPSQSEDDSSGIYVWFTNNILIGGATSGLGNKISHVDWDGVKIAGSANNTTVQYNDIDHTGRVGIFSEGASNNTITDNSVHDANHDTLGIITVLGGTNHYIARNEVWNNPASEGDHGIYIWKAKGVNTIDDNYAHDVSLDGIYAEDVTQLDVTGNSVRDVGNDGIHVTNSDFADITGNDINGAGRDGINVSDGIFADIENNDIFGEDGLFGVGTNGAGRDGIHVVNGYGVDIIDNNITGGDGLFLGLGGFGVGRDGIFVRNSDYADVRENEVSAGSPGILALPGAGAGDDGIDVRNSDFVDIVDNLIDGVLGDGIQVRGSLLADIIANRIRFTGDDGIDVENSAFADVNYNRVRDTLNNGVEVENSYDADVIGNHVRLTGDDGVFVRNSDFADIRNNRIRLTGDDGIDVRSSDGVDITGNRIRNTDGDGIQARNSDFLDIDDNRVRFAGDDGIDVENAFFARIRDNNVRYSDHNGIEVEDSSVVLIDGNQSNDNGDAGIFVDPSNFITVSNNTLNDNTYGLQFDAVDEGNVFGNAIARNDIGFYASGANNGDIRLSDNTFTDNTIGAKFESGLIDLTGPGNFFYNGDVALYFEAYKGNTLYLSLLKDGGGSTYDGSPYDTWPTTDVPVNFGGTIGAQYFEGQTSSFVFLSRETFVDPVSGDAIWLDGSNSTYFYPLEAAAFTPSIDGVDAGRLGFLEDMFVHRPDFAGRGIFFFGVLPDTLADIDQKDLFNRFDPFNGDITGLNVRITGLPRTGFGGAPSPQGFAQGLNNIQTAAGGTNPSDLNQIETAAGGPGNNQTNNNQTNPEDLSNIETSAGGDNTSCWSDAAAGAAGGQAVNVVYGGSFDDNLSVAGNCGTSF